MNHSEENKENTPPFNYDNLVDYLDKKFDKYDDFKNYIEANFKEWHLDPDFRLFTYTYCHHRLMQTQLQQYLRMEQEILAVKTTTLTNNHTAITHAREHLVNLKQKGFDKHVARIENPPKRPKKESKNCPKCRLPLNYDHVAWCRGFTDGYTCRCKTTVTVERTMYASTSRRPHTHCFLCKATDHVKQDCTEYRCRRCNIWAPGHRPRNCPVRPPLTIKEEDDGTLISFDDGNGYYDIEGYEDGNLNGEC